MCYLTCGYRRQRPESDHLRCRCGLHLHGEPAPPGQVRATWRSVSRQDIPDPATDRGLTAAVFEQVNRLFDDFARALGRPPSSWHSVSVLADDQLEALLADGPSIAVWLEPAQGDRCAEYEQCGQC